MNEVNTYNETADIETSSEDYASRFSGVTGLWMLSVQERIVKRLIDNMPGCRILDVGGGHGQLAIPLSEAGYDVTVLGSSEVCAERMKSQIDAGKIKFVVGDVLGLPFRDGEFDVVISIRLLPHCDRWRELVKEMCRVASRYALVDYPTGQSLNFLTGALFGAKKKLEGNTRPYTLFSHSEVKAAFEDCGYRKSGLRKEFFVPMVVHRMLKCPMLSSFMEGVSAALGLRLMLGSPVIAKFEKMRFAGWMTLNSNSAGERRL